MRLAQRAFIFSGSHFCTQLSAEINILVRLPEAEFVSILLFMCKPVKSPTVTSLSSHNTLEQIKDAAKRQDAKTVKMVAASLKADWYWSSPSANIV